MVSGSQAAQHFQQRHAQASEALRWYEELNARVQELGRRSRLELEQVALELARAYLPELEPPFLARIEPLTGFVGFKHHDPLKAREHERHVLVQSGQRIEADERYRQRELLAGRDGTLVSKQAQARESLELFRAECAKFEDLEGFHELIEIGYDTPDFSESFWHSSYWRHWSLGDRICAALGMKDFGDDVLPAYNEVAGQRNFWQVEHDGLQAQIREIHELVKKHDEIFARARNLNDRYLAECQKLLARHLAEADVGLLDEWLGKESGDRGVRMALRKLSGLRAKFDIMRELHDQGLGPLLRDLAARRDKYARKAHKFSGYKYAYQQLPDEVLDLRFDEKYDKLEAERHKLAALVDRIAAYHEYDRFDLDNDPDLWWHAFSGGKRPPRWLPQTRRYYEQHPELAPRYDDALSEQAAVAEAAREAAQQREDRGYLS